MKGGAPSSFSITALQLNGDRKVLMSPARNLALWFISSWEAFMALSSPLFPSEYTQLLNISITRAHSGLPMAGSHSEDFCTVLMKSRSAHSRESGWGESRQEQHNQSTTITQGWVKNDAILI